MHRTVRYALLLVVCLALSAGRAAAQAPPPACVAPTGGDDTVLLQSALERCSRATTADCSVVLCAGVFQTGILRVDDFRGTLRGAGPLATTLRALPDLPVNPSSAGFFRDDPFDTGTGAWPYLLQFVEGRATIRDLGILIPDPPDPSRPTSGWFLLDSLGPYFELRGAMLITGRNGVEFDVFRIRVEAETDALSEVETTAFGGVEFAGLLFDDRGLEPFPVLPARGTFRLADSEILGVAGGSMNSELDGATVTITNNVYRAGVAIDVIDAHRSQISILSNRWQASLKGVQMIQNLDGAPSEASEFMVDGNQGTVATFLSGAGDGISFQDPIDASPVPGGSTLSATRNVLQMANGAGPTASGISARGADQLRLVSNTLTGNVLIGLDVDVTQGCLVWSNTLVGLTNGTRPDLRLGPATQGCIAKLAPGDVVQDLGTGNLVFPRVRSGVRQNVNPKPILNSGLSNSPAFTSPKNPPR